MFSAFQSNSFQSNAFQILTQVAKKVTDAFGGSGSRRKRAKRYYVKYEDQILIFENIYQAEAWTEAQNLQEQIKKSKQEKKARLKRKLQELEIEPPLEKIDISAIKGTAKEFGRLKSINELLSTNSLYNLVEYYKDLLDIKIDKINRRNQDDEDDIELLLMAI